MILTADYHTHTVFSHGKGTILDNAIAASEKGLKEIGITDHGFAHPVFGLTAKKLPVMRRLCDEASAGTGVKVLLGIESNIIGTGGLTDLMPDRYEYFDIFLAGLHKLVKYKFGSMFSLGLPNLMFSTFKAKSVPKSLIETNTQTVINVIKNNPVDVITHLNFCSYCDAEEVAKVAADYGTYIELNSKKVHLSDEDLYRVVRTGVNFVIDSDAHTPDRVGDFKLVAETLERVEVPEKRIHNVNGRFPTFRFKEFKEKNL